jgi:hypothetical protein
MPRSLTPRQARQNAAFLAALARTGNARLAARALALNRSTFTRRRARDPAFAARWQAALAAADAALRARGPPTVLASAAKQSSLGTAPGFPLKTKGGEPAVARAASGRLQLRRAAPGRMTPAAGRAFLAALADSANVRLAAAAAGFAPASFHARKRRDPAFAREMEVAIAIAADRLVWAQVERALRPADEGGPRADLPIPKMTVEQAMMQLMFHRPDGPFQRGRRRHARLRDLAEVAPGIRAKISAIKRAGHFKRTGRWRYDDE